MKKITKSKFFKIILLFLVGIILYFIFCFVQLNRASNYFDERKYNESYKITRFLIPFDNKDLKKYTLYWKYATYYETFEEVYNKHGLESEEFISKEIFDLTYGLYISVCELKKPISEYKQNIIKDIANLYYNALYDKFFMSSSQADELIETYNSLSIEKIKEVSNVYSSTLYENLKNINNITASGIELKNVILSNDSYFTTAKGTITNNGSRKIYYVKIKGVFEDSFGNVIDTDWTYAVGSEGLSPGESKKWQLSVDKDFNIKKINLFIIDYDFDSVKSFMEN